MTPYLCFAGLPGGAGASAGVAAEERGDGEQVSESQGGGADGPEPTGEEGAGGHCAGAAGTTVRMHENTHEQINAPDLSKSSRSSLDYIHVFVPLLTCLFSMLMLRQQLLNNFI